jgi:hypothetical protein
MKKGMLDFNMKTVDAVKKERRMSGLVDGPED